MNDPLHKHGGKNPKLSILDKLIIMLGYYREYRSMENIAFDYGVVKSTICDSGIRNFKKEYFNDAIRAVIVILIVSSFLFVLSNLKIIKSDEQQVVTTLIFSSLIYAPVVEELVNRYALGLFLEKIIKKDYLINIITSLLFSFLHVFKIQLDLIGVFVYGIIYFLLGFTCGYYYRKIDNILVSMLIHFIWNLLIISGVIIRMIL